MSRHVPALVLLAALLTACATTAPAISRGRGPARAARYVQGVPFYPQEENYCGPATLASVLGYWGIPVTQAEVAREVYLDRLKGTLSIDMLLYAERAGLRARMLKGNLALLRASVDRGRPVVALLNLGSRLVPAWHYVVVVGYDDTSATLITYSGRDRDRAYSYGAFSRAWARAAFWALVVEPADMPG
ncbi:MAG: PA2778 family cysteine peptidase [Candidatus Methylomirabilales bacterium]